MPPSMYQALLMWLESIRMSQRLRRGLAAAALILSLLALVPVVLNAGPTPGLLGKAVERLAERQGLDIEIDQVRIAGAGRVVLEGVELIPSAGVGVEGRLSVPRAVVWVELAALLKGDSRLEDLVSRVTLVNPEVELTIVESAPRARRTPDPDADGPTQPSDAPSASPSEVQPIRLTVDSGRFQLAGLGESLSGTFDLDIEWHGRDLRIDTLDISVAEGIVTGQASTHGKAVVKPSGIEWEGETALKDAAVTLGDDRYRVDSALVAHSYREGVITISDATASTETGSVHVVGEITTAGALDLQIAADKLDLAGDLPFLARLGFDGPGSFDGTLTGTFDDFTLAGRATTGPGTFWGRADVAGSGDLVVTKDALAFANVRMYQYAGRYDLEGHYRYAQADSPGSLEIGVESAVGRVQELLALLGFDVPLTGRFDGTLHFAGELGAVGAQGEVVLHDVEVADQPLDRVQGSFLWDGETLLLRDGAVHLGAGQATIAGQAAADGSEIDLSFEAQDWPLGMMQAIDAAWGHVLGANLSVSGGRIEGSVEELRVSGDLLTDALRLGPTLFSEVGGRFEFDSGTLRIDGLHAQRTDGGSYMLSGSLEPFAEVPTADLAMDVYDERLRGLLELAGQELPAMLLDGYVDGRITLQGELNDPTVGLDLLWGDTFGVGRALDLKLALHEGSLRVDHVRLIRPEQRTAVEATADQV